MTYEVDLTGVFTQEDFHKRIKEILPLPDYYGNNLDALHDVLTENRDWIVSFVNLSDIETASPDYFEAIKRMCLDCGVCIMDNNKFVDRYEMESVKHKGQEQYLLGFIDMNEQDFEEFMFDGIERARSIINNCHPTT